MHLQTLLIVIMLSSAYGQDRTITATLNPGCENCTAETTLVYVKCEGTLDTIHQIWDFTRHTPTVIFALGSPNSIMNITWDKKLPRSIDLSEIPKYSFAISIDRLFEYDDLEDKGYAKPNYPHKEYKLNNMRWYLNETVLTNKEAMIHVYGIDEHGKQGVVNIKLDLIPFKDYAVELPHLIHTANSTLIDISLVNLPISKEYNASRYALHLMLVSTDPVTDTMHFTSRKSLDDEHTPGVFKIIEILTPALYDKDEGGYLQFRPVGYRQRERTVASSTAARASNFSRINLPEKSTLKLFYNTSKFEPSNLVVQDMYVFFGEPGDGFYKQYNYTAWSFTMGYGTPPTESVSLLVTMIISVGLGMPVLVALSGITYVLVRRYKQRQNHMTRFTNDV